LIHIIYKNLIENFKLIAEIPVDEHFGVMTLHRPSNVDSREILLPIIRFLFG